MKAGRLNDVIRTGLPMRCIAAWHVWLGFLFLAVENAVGDGEGLPQWLDIPHDYEAICERIDSRSDAVVLDSWKRVTYMGRGTVQSRVGKAFHLRSRAERGRAIARIQLLNKSQKLKAFKAWLIYQSGVVEVFDKSDGYIRANDLDSLYSDSSSFVLDRSASINTDDVVFAYEYTLVEKSVFMQDKWRFQETVPVIRSSIEIVVPRNWEVKGWVMGSYPVDFVRDRQFYRWTAVGMGRIRYDEVDRKPQDLLVTQIGITVMPPSNSYDARRNHVFDTWQDVARFGNEAQSKHVATSEAIDRKAQELTSGAKSLWEKARSICDYVQSMNYVGMSVDLNGGGGYEPNNVEAVFRRHYGDCKDMTALAISMLDSQQQRAVTATSFSITLYVRGS